MDGEWWLEDWMVDPLIFFVHVPKTAGSTVNAVLHEVMPKGRSHCEGFIADQEQFARSATICPWLSGHIPLDLADEKLATAPDREVRFFACMRDPSKHVRSHYNWLIEIFHRRREFYDTHPERIKEISETIRSSRQDARSIVENLRRFPGLFLNSQSRMILGSSFNWNTGAIHQRLARYEMIVDSDNVDMLITHLIRGQPVTNRRENASNYHFDPAVFDTDQIRDFLRNHNTLDELLYSALDLQSGEPD